MSESCRNQFSMKSKERHQLLSYVGLLENKYHHGWVLNGKKGSKWRKLKPTGDPDHHFDKTLKLFNLFEKEKHKLVDPATLRRMRLPKN